MIKQCMLILLLLSISVSGGAGSGIAVKVGVAKAGLTTTDKDYKILTVNHNALFPIEGQAPVLPAVSLAYSLSLHRMLSVSAGVGFLTVADDFKANLVTSDIDLYWEVDEKYRSYYLTVPVEIQGMIPIKNGGIYASFTPQPGFLLSAKHITHNTDPGGIITDTVINVRDIPGNNISVFNFSLGFRIGGEIGIGKHNLLIESGYDFGLTNVDKAVFEDKEVGTRTGVLTILCVGFRFNTSDVFRR